MRASMLNAADSDARSPLLGRAFFARDAQVVARELIGALLVRDQAVVRITEVEAYRGPADSACHARHGRTARNAALWGPPGKVYMYLCYGMHMMLNVVAGEAEGAGHAVLVRAGEVVAGHEVVQARRGGARVSPAVLTGPGKLAQGLALDLAFNHHDVCAPGGLELRRRTGLEVAPAVLSGPRVGIDYARPRDRRALLRFAQPGSLAVSERCALVDCDKPRSGRRTA